MKEKTTKDFAINLFLRTIGAENETCNIELVNDLSQHIDKDFKRIGCCVLWFKSLETSCELSKILKKYNIHPNMDEKFSIIMRGYSVLFSKGTEKIPRLVFTGPNDSWTIPTPKTETKIPEIPEDVRDWIY